MPNHRDSIWSRVAVLAALGVATGCGGDSQRSGTRDDPATGGSTATGGSSATGGNTATGGGRNEPAPCSQRGVERPGGFATCTEGYEHRPRAEACGPPLTEQVVPGGTCDPALILEGDITTCMTDDECVERASGRCNYNQSTAAGPGGCACDYPCASDADCGSGFVCECGDRNGTVTGRCVPALCSTDADCGENLCALTDVQCPRVFSCFSERDTCRSNADCPSSDDCHVDTSTGERHCGTRLFECMGG